jgi:hypothetical protein
MNTYNIFRVHGEAVANVAEDLDRFGKYAAQNIDSYAEKLEAEEDEDGYWHKEVQKYEYERLLYKELLDWFKSKYMKGI